MLRRASWLSCALLSMLWSTSALATEVPWARSLSDKQEEAFLERSLEGLAEDDPVRELLPIAAAAGALVSYGSCQSSGTVREDITADWLGEVESIATVELANLSDDYIWLVEIGVSSKPGYEALAKLASDDRQAGAWAGNLPFLPPHSAAALRMGCNDLLVGGLGRESMSVDALEIDSVSGALEPAVARRMSRTAVRFGRAKGGRLVATAPGAQSLAAAALPLLSEREDARELAKALYTEIIELEGSEDFARVLGIAELEAAEGIVDMLLAAVLEPEELDALLEAVVPRRNERNDEALARLVAEVCALVTPARRRELFLATVGREGRLWQKAFIPACELDAADSLYVIDALLDSGDGHYEDNEEALELFVEFAADASFEVALPTLLGAREPGSPIPGEEDMEGEGEGEGEGDTEGEPELELVDGGSRPVALWRALAWPPESETRAAALEALIRARDVSAVLAELVPVQMNPDRLALFDRVAARVEDIPAAERGAALTPVMRAGLASPYLEPELTRRLFALSEHDRASLRAIMLEAMAKNQQIFTLEALSALDHDYEQLISLFEGPLDGCTVNLRSLETCFDTIEGDPQLLAAAQVGGLRDKFLARLAKAVAKTDPDDRQRALLDRALALGVSADPAVEAVCARYEELEDFKLDTEVHLDFLDTYGREHPCASTILASSGQGTWKLIQFGLAAALLFGFGALVWWIQRRRTAALLSDD